MLSDTPCVRLACEIAIQILLVCLNMAITTATKHLTARMTIADV